MLAPVACWYCKPHPTTARQLFLCLVGEWEVTFSDGEQRRFGPDGVVLLEDVTGKEHATRIVGVVGGLAAMVQAPADAPIAGE